jgi:small subunit ribosomal protein S20
MNLAAFEREGGVLGTRSAEKAHRQSIKRRLRNRAVKSATKSAIKRANETIAGGDIDAAREAVRTAISALDRAAQKGVVHPNNAGRRKSRLLLRYNASVAALQTPVEERPAGKGKPARAKASGSKTTKTGKKTTKRAPAKKAKK